MRDVNEFKGHGGGSINGIFDTTGWTETAVTSEGNKFERTTGRASIHGTAKGWIAAVNHFFNILDNSLPGMKNIYHFFVMVSKNVL